MIYLFDLDNTIANMDHRLPLLANGGEVDWDKFEAACVDDEPIDSTIQIMKALVGMGQHVYIWTGRSDGVKDKTIAWLKQYAVPYTQLLMLPHGSTKLTVDLKRDWLNDDPVPRRKVAAAFDDDPKIIKMLMSEGVICYQVKRT